MNDREITIKAERLVAVTGLSRNMLRAMEIDAESEIDEEMDREQKRLAKEHAALLLILDQSLQVAAGLEDARCKVEGMLFRMTDGRGSLGQLSTDLLQLRVKAN